MTASRDRQAPTLSAAQHRFFAEKGYLILDGLFDAARIAAAKRRISDLWADRSPDNPLVVDYYDADILHRTLLRETDAAVRDLPYKLNDTHLFDPLLRDLSTDPRLVAAVAELLGATPLVCNTLLMERGSQQGAHFDTFYMPSRTPNLMCASWIALDAGTPGNGPLFYYPKSHLIAPFRFSSGKLNAILGEMPAAEAHMARIIAEHGLQEQRFYPNPGDVLIWHAQLLHGGSRIEDLRQTRTSLVTHYWTTHDHPDPDSWITVGPGRYLLRRPHQHVASTSDPERIDRFVAALTTPPDHVAGCPDGFDPRRYLLRNLDVFRGGMDPYTHYHLHGRHEGRGW